MAETAVVILNFNGEKYLKQFLPGVIDHSPQADVIVVDNNSSDGSIDYLKTHEPNISVIAFDQNHGFTGGYNRVLEKLKYTFCVLLNSDVEVTADWLPPVIDFMKANDEVAACQPKILAYHEKEKFEYAGACGGYIDTLGFPYCRGRIFETLETDQGQYNTTTEVFWATGACLFVRTELFNQASGFDEDLFAHMEEIDLCWRFQLMGKKAFCIPQSVVYHVGGGTLSKSNPRKTYFNFRNNLTMLIKNDSLRNLVWKLPIKFALDWIAAFKFWADNSFIHFWAVMRAHAYFFGHLIKNLRKRKHVNELRNGEASITPSGFITFDYFIKGRKTFDELNK